MLIIIKHFKIIKYKVARAFFSLEKKQDLDFIIKMLKSEATKKEKINLIYYLFCLYSILIYLKLFRHS